MSLPESVVYGIHPVREMLRADATKVERLWIAQGAENPRLKELIAEAKRSGIPVRFEPKAALQRRAGCEHHQDVVATIAQIRPLDEDTLLDRCREDALLLVLDGISDPQNLGAIFRTAEAAAVSGIFLPERHTAPVSAAVVRASAGAAHYLPIARIGNVSNFIRKLKERNFRVVGLDAHAQASWCDADLTGPVALVLGSEGEGLRRLVKQNCDQLVRLPMGGRVESLNVSAAAAAVLFEAVRQRMVDDRRANV